MASKQMVYMNQGEGETSYARNSAFQSSEQNWIKPLIEAATVELRSRTSLLDGKMVVADLGCSSGPNAVALVSVAVEAIHSFEFLQTPLEVCILLNDLPGNDFNTVVRSLVTLQEQSNEHVVMTGVVPGSFYERLFSSGYLHLICSSNSLHWLSKAPEELTRNQIPAYNIDEYGRCRRLPMVIETYAKQFREDFTRFLKLRAKELVPRGRMVLCFPGRRSDEISSKPIHLLEIFAQILCAMALEGVIDKAKFDSFYVPIYTPSDEEVREAIQEEGSFSIKEMRLHDFISSSNSALITASWFANQIRAAFEPLVVQHFGEVMDEFVRTAERRWSLEGSLQDEFSGYSVSTISLSLIKA